MIELSNRQIDLLYEACDWHHKWYAAYYTDPPTFDILLQLNHRKLTYMFENQQVNDDIKDDALNKMIFSYQTMFENYS